MEFNTDLVFVCPVIELIPDTKALRVQFFLPLGEGIGNLVLSRPDFEKTRNERHHPVKTCDNLLQG